LFEKNINTIETCILEKNFEEILNKIDKKQVKIFVQKTICTKKQSKIVKYIVYNLINFNIINNKFRDLKTIENRLIVESNFDSNFWNRLDSTIPILEIDLKLDSISIIFKSNQLDSTRFSISILEIESNCQEIENYVIMSRISIFEFKF